MNSDVLNPDLIKPAPQHPIQQDSQQDSQQDNDAQAPLSLWLKEGTTTIHDALDKRIMSLDPFASTERYQCFLRTQSRLHQAVSKWFQNEDVQTWLPDLKDRDRSEQVLQDCADLEVSADEIAADRAEAQAMSINNAYEALGWLYTVEGSNLGASVLLRHARKSLDLSESFGARHLAAHMHGRGQHWLGFKNGLDAIALNDEQRELALSGAKQAFEFARANIEALMMPETAPAEAL